MLYKSRYQISTMRITNNLARSRKLGHVEPVPFKEILPLKLKPLVSGKGGKVSDVCCIYEMTLMLACFKENEFGATGCAKEIEDFKKCYVNHVTAKRNKIARESKGLLTAGEKNLSPKQINLLLKKYPNIN